LGEILEKVFPGLSDRQRVQLPGGIQSNCAGRGLSLCELVMQMKSLCLRKPLPHSVFEALVCLYHPRNDLLASLLTQMSSRGLIQGICLYWNQLLDISCSDRADYRFSLFDLLYPTASLPGCRWPPAPPASNASPKSRPGHLEHT